MVEKKQKNELKEQRIRTVMEKTGWTYDFAVEQIEDARKRLGVSYKEYLLYNLFNVHAEEQKYEEALLQTRQKAEERRESVIAEIMATTGWDHDFAKNKIEEARERTGCTYKGYLGWDIAITEEGPAIVEVNTVPGVILFQLPYIAEKKV